MKFEIKNLVIDGETLSTQHIEQLITKQTYYLFDDNYNIKPNLNMLGFCNYKDNTYVLANELDRIIKISINVEYPYALMQQQAKAMGDVAMYQHLYKKCEIENNKLTYSDLLKDLPNRHVNFKECSINIEFGISDILCDLGINPVYYWLTNKPKPLSQSKLETLTDIANVKLTKAYADLAISEKCLKNCSNSIDSINSLPQIFIG